MENNKQAKTAVDETHYVHISEYDKFANWYSQQYSHPVKSLVRNGDMLIITVSAPPKPPKVSDAVLHYQMLSMYGDGSPIMTPEFYK